MNRRVSRREFLGVSVGGMAALAAGLRLDGDAGLAANEASAHAVEARLARYDGNLLIEDAAAAVSQSARLLMKLAGCEWACYCTVASVPERPDATDFVLNFKVVQGSPQNHSIGVRVRLEHWSVDNYVLIPAALYNGNRFESRPLSYPPLLTDPKDIGPNVPTIITDVPRLNISGGPSKVQLIAGDMATPAIGFYAPKTKQGYWLLTEQRTSLGDTGLSMEERPNRDRAYITLTAPHVREKHKYHANTTTYPSDDRGADFRPGDEIRLRFRTYEFPCSSIQGLFDRFVEIRKDLSGRVTLHHQLPFSAAWRIQEEKYRYNWVDDYGYYSVGMRTDRYEDWQPGWTGGLMVTYPLLIEGDNTSRARVLNNFDFVFPGGTGTSGYLRGIEHEGKWYSDGFEKPHAEKWVMARKSADVLYFMVKQLMLLSAQAGSQKISSRWTDGGLLQPARVHAGGQGLCGFLLRTLRKPWAVDGRAWRNLPVSRQRVLLRPARIVRRPL
jgi:hypothetical protein